jgi:membrane protein YdbS with pleckstrin-like domain
MGLSTTLGTIRDFRDTLREWRAFKHRTGRWPVLWVITYALLWIGLITGVVLLLLYSEHHSWTRPRLMLIVLATLVPLAVVWETVERAVRLVEMRRSGVARRKTPDQG